MPHYGALHFTIIGELDRGLRRYRTHLFSLGERGVPRPPYKGRGWHFALHYLTYRGLKSDFLLGTGNESFRKSYPGIQWSMNWGEHTRVTDFETVSSPEIIVFAENRSKAQQALRLAEAAYVLVAHVPDFLTPSFLAIPDGEEESQDFMEHGTDASFGGGCASSFCLSAWIAAKASHKRQLVYALMKYLLSRDTCFVDVMATNPSERADRWGEKDPAAHVIFANAIIQAYAVIEELGFEVRASQAKPSSIDGRWNPEVKQNLTARLVSGRINLADHETWITHGPPRKIDRSQPHLTGPKAPWAWGAVRDMALAVEDAIARASFLRSRVSSHRLGRRAANLTALDVANVQLLARRLLLEHIGAFKYMGWAQQPAQNRRPR